MGIFKSFWLAIVRAAALMMKSISKTNHNVAENMRATRVFCLQCLLIHEQGTSHHLRTHSHDQSLSHTHIHTLSLTRQWRQAGVWSRKPSGWRKWRSPPSSLPLTLLINITKAYFRNSQHKVTSCPGFNKLSPVRASQDIFDLTVFTHRGWHSRMRSRSRLRFP